MLATFPLACLPPALALLGNVGAVAIEGAAGRSQEGVFVAVC